MEDALCALYRPSPQHAATRVEPLLLPRLHAAVAELLRHAPPLWAPPLLHAVLANLCCSLASSLQLPDRRFSHCDLSLLQADVARLGAFFETDLRSLDGGTIDAEVVGSNTKYLYQAS